MAWSVPPALRHDVALVVSELVANAVKHGCGPVGLRVDVSEAADATTVRIAVHDEGSGQGPSGPLSGERQARAAL